MQNVTVKKAELHKVLLENRAKHAEEFKTAIEGWRTATAKRLRENANSVADGNSISPMLGVDLSAPESHDGEYAQVIRMVDMSTEDVIKLEFDEFQRYVMDQWHWKRDHLIKTAMYSGVPR